MPFEVNIIDIDIRSMINSFLVRNNDEFLISSSVEFVVLTSEVFYYVNAILRRLFLLVAKPHHGPPYSSGSRRA
jgi:hypothetical protein